jgi:hypothetical protein
MRYKVNDCNDKVKILINAVTADSNWRYWFIVNWCQFTLIWYLFKILMAMRSDPNSSNIKCNISISISQSEFNYFMGGKNLVLTWICFPTNSYFNVLTLGSRRDKSLRIWTFWSWYCRTSLLEATGCKSNQGPDISPSFVTRSMTIQPLPVSAIKWGWIKWGFSYGQRHSSQSTEHRTWG